MSISHLILFLLILIIQQCISFKPVTVTEQNRQVPAWTSYQYLEEPDHDLTVREYVLQEQDQRTYLMCPKGYSIGQVAVALLLSKDQLDNNESMRHKTVVYKYSVGAAVVSDKGDRHTEDEGLVPEDLCPTLSHCLMYQACVFNFGNELCRKDPNPGARKNINTNITCIKDGVMETHLHNSDLGEQYFQVFEDSLEKRDKVLNIMYDSKLDYGIEDFENTEFKMRESDEAFVFDSSCPEEPRKAGYKGECNKIKLSKSEVGQNIWHLTSRVTKPRCKQKINEVYCAFKSNPTGKCVPPHLLKKDIQHWQHSEVFNENAYPKLGSRPHDDFKVYQNHLDSYKYKNILPARIGFALLVHKDVHAIINLMEHIYRTQHFYVFHVDKRKENIRQELIQQLGQKFPRHNIHVLSKERSFITSWGSFGIVRAHLEQFEELCRMGVWDFVINMSGADLSVRNVDDLSLALAPYRGHNFFAFHGNIRNEDLTKDQGLCWEAWYECDGFTFNVTRSAGQPISDVLEIKTTSQWATLSRPLIEHLLDQESHSEVWRSYDFHMQTSVIPDESYLSTFALNSPMKGQTHHVGLYWLKRFSGQTKYNLCKHLGDADFCGQGPSDIDKGDMSELADMTHRYFFARKFPTDNLNNEVRTLANKFSRNDYYKNLQKYIPPQIVHQLMQNALRYLQLENGTDLYQYDWKLKLDSLKIVPLLQPTQPCCHLPFERHYKSIQEFSHILDFTATPAHEERGLSIRARYNILPQCNCYPRGHLRAVRATAWTEEGSDDQRPLSINTPFPYHPAGSRTIFGELWFHAGDASLPPKCRETKRQMVGEVAEIQNIVKDNGDIKGDTMKMIAKLSDTNGVVRCEHWVEVSWQKKELRDEVEKAVMFSMPCGHIEPGKWKFSVQRANVAEPFIYELDMLFLELANTDTNHLSSPPDIGQVNLLQGVWQVDTVATLPLQDFYQDQERLLEPFLVNKRNVSSDSLKSHHHPRHKRSIKREEKSLFHRFFHTWIVCSGGLITLVLSLLFSFHTLYLPLRYPSRYQKRALYYSFSVILTTCFLQSILCSFFCDHND